MKTFIYLSFSSMLFFFGCSKDEALTEVTFIDNTETYIQVSESKNHINIHVESLLDTIDDRRIDYPNGDFCTIAFDVNNNGVIDSDLDFGFSSPSLTYDICAFYFKDSISVSPCGGFESSAAFDDDFASSDLSSKPHIIWDLSIPKDDFNDNRTINFIVKTYQPGLYRTYPEERLFENSLRFNFQETMTVEW